MAELTAHAALDAEHRVLLVGPTPVDESRTRPVTYRKKREYRLGFIEEYNEIVRQIASRAGVGFADLFVAMQPHEGHWHEWDGVHLNAAAHKQVADVIEAELAAVGWGIPQVEAG
jgi:lysophospholipase L1-like esterase